MSPAENKRQRADEKIQGLLAKRHSLGSPIDEPRHCLGYDTRGTQPLRIVANEHDDLNEGATDQARGPAQDPTRGGPMQP